MWPSAVRSEMTSCDAMSRLVSPCATRDATSRCRRVSCSTSCHPDQSRATSAQKATRQSRLITSNAAAGAYAGLAPLRA